PAVRRVHTHKGILGPGIDVQGEDGLCTVPPSLHWNGRRYAWSDGLGPSERPPVELPAELRSALLRRPGPRWYLAMAPYWLADRAHLSMNHRQTLRTVQARLR